MWTNWICAVLGVWLIVSPWIPGAQTLQVPGTSVPAHNIIVGVMVLVVALLGIRAHRKAPAAPPPPERSETPTSGDATDR